MKKYFKSICAALGALMAVSALTACGPIKRGGSTGDNGGDEIKPDDDGLAASITVHYYAGGFGNETNKLLSADFKALTGKTVKWEPSYTVGEIQQLLVNNQERFDIVMPLMNMYQAEDAKRLEDITSVYNSTYEGENKAIKDKMNQTLLRIYRSQRRQALSNVYAKLRIGDVLQRGHFGRSVRRGQLGIAAHHYGTV